MPASPSVRATRRRVIATTVAAGGVAAGAAACTLPTGTENGDPTPPTRGPGTAAAPEPSADQVLVTDVAEELAATAALVAGARRGRPGLRRRLRGVADLHRAHVVALPGDGATREPARVRGDEDRALRQVRAAERELQRRLEEAALAAESGPLAALLASMSAAVAQRLATGELG